MTTKSRSIEAIQKLQQSRAKKLPIGYSTLHEIITNDCIYVDKTHHVANLVNNDGCFDLQFRKDTRHERTNAPTYYRWKTQFVVTSGKDNVKVLEKIKDEMGCGEVSISKDQARFSVQKISDIAETVVPFFKKNCLADKNPFSRL